MILEIPHRHFIGMGKTSERRLEAALAQDGSVARGATISPAVIADTRTAQCKCEDAEHMVDLVDVRGIMYPGMLTSELRDLGSGCTAMKRGAGLSAAVQGVCTRLDKLRRRYDL